MIVDVHTHVGTADHVGPAFAADLDCCWSGLTWNVDLDEHREHARSVDAAIVLAFDAPASDIVVPNEYVAAYVATDPGRLIGFGSVDPHRPDALARVAALADLGLVGMKLGPIYQGLAPTDPRMMAVFAACERLSMPVLCHQGTTFVRNAPLRYALPHLLDDVAMAFPDLRLTIAHLGHPWIAETMAVIRKHRHLTADVSALATRPFQLYTALVTAMEYGVTDKIIFGSDYPFGSAAGTISALEATTRMHTGTSFPGVPDAVVESIVHRDALGMLGID